MHSYLHFLFPVIAASVSSAFLLVQLIQRTVKLKKIPNHDQRINGLDPASRRINHQGSQDDLYRSGQLQEDSRLLLHPVDTHTSVKEVSRPRGEMVVVIIEVLAVVCEVVISLIALLTNVLGRHGTPAALARLVVWSYICILALLRLLLTSTGFTRFYKLWYHTAFLYQFQWLLTLFLFRSAIIHPRSPRAQALTVTGFVLNTILAIIAITSRRGNKRVILEHEDDLEPSKEPLASLFSLATFSWMDPMVWQGFKKPLQIVDVWNLVPKDKAAAVHADFKRLRQTSKLAWHLLKYFRRNVLMQALWAVFSAITIFMPTLLLKAILEYVEDPESAPVNTAWFYLILLTFATILSAVTDGQCLWIGRKTCIRLRAIIIGEIYAKTLRRKAAAGSDKKLGDNPKKESARKANKKGSRKLGLAASDTGRHHTEISDSQVNAGTIINLMAVDSFKVSEISAYLHYLWINSPLLLILCIVLLYKILGYSSLAAVGLMTFVMPLNYFLAQGFTRTQKHVMAATDARIHTTNEVLQNIRIIKYFAWESRFAALVNEKRAIELRALRNRYILWAFAAMVWFGIPLVITFFSFLLYTMAEKKPLKPSVAFSALSLFSILRVPLDQFADMLAHVQETKVSIERVEEYLDEDETRKYVQLRNERNEDGEPFIGFKNATFTWGAKGPGHNNGNSAFQMIDLDIRFHIGQLNIIAGPTGSGKTSLLMALLGEMTILNGSVMLPNDFRENLRPDPRTGLTEGIAYCSQQAWLVNDTIKHNILFASPWDEMRYRQVLQACALTRDLEILDDGDSTLVGEKGITLSGGQKQRVSLARALYSNARHLLLDDCLSAVDSETAKHLFEHCILGPLMQERTCILVTHNTALCVPRSRYVVVLANGKISAQGTPDEIMSLGVLGDDVYKSKPTSKSGTRAPSRIHSSDNLGGKTATTMNGSVLPSNLNMNNREQKPDERNGPVEKANTRTEDIALGSVKWVVIKMYLGAMGPWFFWVLACVIFAAQQIASVSTNVWIREWANSYEIERFSSMRLWREPQMVNRLHRIGDSLASDCLPMGTCELMVPSYPHEPTLHTERQLGVNATHYLGIYALLSLIYLLVSFVREALIFWGSLRASWTIHFRLLESVTRAKFKFFDSTPLGQLMNRFSQDLEAIDQEVAPITIGFLGCLASIVSIVMLISIITPGFLIAGVFITILYFAIGAFYIRSSRDLKRLESVQRSPLYQQFGETLSGAITIRAYRDESRFIRDNQHRIDTHNRPFLYLWATNRWLSMRVDFAGALVSFFAGMFVILSIGRIDAGAAGLSLTYAVTFTENVLWLVRMYSKNEQNMNSIERVKEYLDVEREAKAVIPENRPPGNWPDRGAVQFVNYSTRYRSDLEPVLHNVTFNIGAGERVGIVGRTGAGKSSLAMALFRGLEAEEGKIVVDDVNIGLIGLQDLREAITIVPQDPTLFTGTIRSNLDPFNLFTDEEIFTTLRRVQLIDSTAGSTASTPKQPITINLPIPPESSSTISSSNSSESSSILNHAPLNLARKLTNTHSNANIFTTLSSPIAESGSNLSQGQRQLLCLARALLKSPRVLVMDEATASIDYSTDAHIQDTLRDVKDTTIITIAHRLQTIVDYDRILVLDKGQVVEYGEPWALMEKEGGWFRGMCEVSGDWEGLVEGAMRARDKKRLIDV